MPTDDRTESLPQRPLHDPVLDSINEGVFTVDSDWRITSFNAAAERITQVPRDQAIGRACCDVFRASICESRCALRQTLTDGKPVVQPSVYIVRADGQRVPIRISTAILRDADGQVVGGVETFQDLSQIEELRKELTEKYSFGDIVGRSAAMRQLFALLAQVAESDSTVLLEGATGTGKELFARAIHDRSRRNDKPFVAINCGALPDSLLESELFGYKAGAFTDARSDKPGLFASAEGGTIFLDEIGDVSPAMQVRLLRVLQERVYQPLGALEPVSADVRVVAATNRPLAELVEAGSFREDLYYRVRVVGLKLPALAERREDIPLLVEHFVERFNRRSGKGIEGVDDEVMLRLLNHPFAGNVRELENVIEHAFVLCRGGLIGVEHLPPELRGREETGPLGGGSERSLAAMEKVMIADALRCHGGNRKAAARQLGIDPSTLFRKVKALGLDLPARDGRSRPRP